MGDEPITSIAVVREEVLSNLKVSTSSSATTTTSAAANVSLDFSPTASSETEFINQNEFIELYNELKENGETDSPTIPDISEEKLKEYFQKFESQSIVLTKNAAEFILKNIHQFTDGVCKDDLPSGFVLKRKPPFSKSLHFYEWMCDEKASKSELPHDNEAAKNLYKKLKAIHIQHLRAEELLGVDEELPQEQENALKSDFNDFFQFVTKNDLSLDILNEVSDDQLNISNMSVALKRIVAFMQKIDPENRERQWTEVPYLKWQYDNLFEDRFYKYRFYLRDFANDAEQAKADSLRAALSEVAESTKKVYPIIFYEELWGYIDEIFPIDKGNNNELMKQFILKVTQ